MENKFNLTREQNIFVAKRNIVDYIYSSANLEGISVTYSQAQAIYEGGEIEGLTTDEVVTINNLKHAWQFILETEDVPTNFNTLREIHKIIGANLIINCGNLRTTPVKMGGTDWVPQFPIESQIKEELEELLKIENETERAITIMLWAMRRQMFLDGNKRTAMLFANKIMIDNGCGIIQIPVRKQGIFFEKLVKFYETKEMEDLKNWIYENAIDGMTF